MPEFWDARHRRPHYWTYVFFPLLTVVLFLLIYMYGARKAAIQEKNPKPQINELL